MQLLLAKIRLMGASVSCTLLVDWLLPCELLGWGCTTSSGSTIVWPSAITSISLSLSLSPSSSPLLSSSFPLLSSSSPLLSSSFHRHKNSAVCLIPESLPTSAKPGSSRSTVMECSLEHDTTDCTPTDGTCRSGDEDGRNGEADLKSSCLHL